MSICPVCKKEFQSDIFHRNTMKFCSRRCRGKNWKILNPNKVKMQANRRAREKTTERLLSLPLKICPTCQKSFAPGESRRNSYRIFCSIKCNQTAQRKNRRAKESYILKHPQEDLEFYWKVRTRKQVTDANYKALKRGCKKCSGNHLHLDEWITIKQAANSSCKICGIIESPQNPLTIDHIVAITNGGENVASNIQPLCRSCNSRKGNRY